MHPPPADVPAEEPEPKKRKLDEGAINGSVTQCLVGSHINDGARFSNHMTANKHLAAVHSIVKKECEQLADSIVSSLQYLSAAVVDPVLVSDVLSLVSQDRAKLWINLSMPK